jgi:hypothetical protein
MAGTDFPPRALATLFLVFTTKLLTREKSPPNNPFSLGAVEGSRGATWAGGAVKAASEGGAWATAAHVRIRIESILNCIVGYSLNSSLLFIVTYFGVNNLERRGIVQLTGDTHTWILSHTPYG